MICFIGRLRDGRLMETARVDLRLLRYLDTVLLPYSLPYGKDSGKDGKELDLTPIDVSG